MPRSNRDNAFQPDLLELAEARVDARFLGEQASRRRKGVRQSCRRCRDRDLAPTRWNGSTFFRVKNVAGTGGAFSKGCALRCRSGEGPRLQRHLSAGGQVNRPGIAVWIAAKGAELACVDQNIVEPFLAKQIGEAIGDEPLRDAVKGQRHTGLEHDPVWCELHVVPADRLSGGGQVRGMRWTPGGGRICVDPPERLDSRIEQAL